MKPRCLLDHDHVACTAYLTFRRRASCRRDAPGNGATNRILMKSRFACGWFSKQYTCIEMPNLSVFPQLNISPIPGRFHDLKWLRCAITFNIFLIIIPHLYIAHWEKRISFTVKISPANLPETFQDSQFCDRSSLNGGNRLNRYDDVTYVSATIARKFTDKEANCRLNNGTVIRTRGWPRTESKAAIIRGARVLSVWREDGRSWPLKIEGT